MNKEQLNNLVNDQLLTDVGFISYYMDDENKELLKDLTIESLSDMGLATSTSTGDYIHPNFDEGGEFVLNKDVVLMYPIMITKDTTIDLNGYNIINPYSFTDESDNSLNSYVFWVKSGKLTIKGNGKIQSSDSQYSMAVWANGGDVDIYGGSYYNEGRGSDLIYASAGGNVNIYGGEFIACKKVGNVAGTANIYTALNIKDRDRDKSSIKVYGGKFYKFDPANNLSEGPNTNFVAEGYQSIKDYDWFVVSAE